LISIAVMGLFGLYCFALLVLKFKRSREVG